MICNSFCRGPRMNSLKFTLLTDGTSDQALIRHLEWLVKRHIAQSTTIQSEWADLSSLREKPTGLVERIRRAIEFYPCDLLFVHRDAERQDPELRHEEVAAAVESVSSLVEPAVAVVPVRMLEAWLLFDEPAIRYAAGNPNGRQSLSLPTLDRVERVPDPKSLLLEALRTASGLSGRRLKNFRARAAVRRVADYVEDFSPLLRLSAFQRLDSDIETEFRRRGWSLDSAPSR